MVVILSLLSFRGNTLSVEKQTIAKGIGRAKINEDYFDVIVCEFHIEFDRADIGDLSLELDENILRNVKESSISFVESESGFQTGISVISATIKYDESDIDLYSYIIENPKLIRIVISNKDNKKFDVIINPYFNLDSSPILIPVYS